MSSSHRSATSKTSGAVDPEVLPCPECGADAMRRHRGECKLLDGLIIPDLESWHCFSCGEDFFDPPAMDIIADVRRSNKVTRSRASKRTMEKKNA